jgi:hypothetical protein
VSRNPATRRSLLEQIQRTVIEDNVLVGATASYIAFASWSYVKDFYPGTNIPESNGARMEAWLDK